MVHSPAILVTFCLGLFEDETVEKVKALMHVLEANAYIHGIDSGVTSFQFSELDLQVVQATLVFGKDLAYHPLNDQSFENGRTRYWTGG